jgi:hypothetical protein
MTKEKMMIVKIILTKTSLLTGPTIQSRYANIAMFILPYLYCHINLYLPLLILPYVYTAMQILPCLLPCLSTQSISKEINDELKVA